MGPSVEIFIGDTKTLLIDVIGVDGEPLSLAGASIRFGLARRPGHARLIEKSDADDITVVDEDAGSISIALESADTAELVPGTYWYEVEVAISITSATVLQGMATLKKTILT